LGFNPQKKKPLVRVASFLFVANGEMMVVLWKNDYFPKRTSPKTPIFFEF
jgi:hypothetical protein